MKITQVYYHQGKFLMLPEGQWPVKPRPFSPAPPVIRDADYSNVLKSYESALTSALYKAVEISDFLKIGRSVLVYLGISPGESLEEIPEKLRRHVKDGVYTLPPTEVEIVIETECKHLKNNPPSVCGTANNCDCPVKRVARIKDSGVIDLSKCTPGTIVVTNSKESLPVEEETQEDILHAVENLIAILHRDGGHYREKHGLLKAIEDAQNLLHVKWNVSEEETQEEQLVKTLEKVGMFIRRKYDEYDDLPGQPLPAFQKEKLMVDSLHSEIQDVLAKYHSCKK